MKKLIVALLVVALCLSVVCPVMADESDFTPSVTYKPMPDLSGSEEENRTRVGNLMVNGEEVIGGVYVTEDGRLVVICDGVHPEGFDKDGNLIGVEEGHRCLLVTAYADVPGESLIPQEDKDLIKWVYEQILALGMKFFENCAGLNEHIASVLGEGKSVQDLVVRDLFEVTVLCDELKAWLEPAGTTITLNFDLGLAPDTFVDVVAYKGQWLRIEDVQLMDDGSVVCSTFENFCPVAILVSETEIAETAAVETVNTGDFSQMALWIAVAGAALIAIVAIAVTSSKKKAK